MAKSWILKECDNCEGTGIAKDVYGVPVGPCAFCDKGKQKIYYLPFDLEDKLDKIWDKVKNL